jgi:ribonuclease HI
VKVNVDAGRSVRDCWARMALIVRTSHGRVELSWNKGLGITRSAHVAELEALRYAMEFVRDSGYRRVWFEVDAREVVKEIITGTWSADVTPIHRDICAIRASFDRFQITAIARDANMAAHVLASHALKDSPREDWGNFDTAVAGSVALVFLDLDSMLVIL